MGCHLSHTDPRTKSRRPISNGSCWKEPHLSYLLSGLLSQRGEEHEGPSRALRMCRRLCGDLSFCCLDFQAALISPRSCATRRTYLYPSTSSGVEYTPERTFVCFIKDTIDRMSLQSFTRTTLCWLASWIVLSHVVSAQSLRANDPCLNAEAYCSRETSSCLWFGIGFCLPFAGPISSYIIKPDPPASAVVGKSSAYASRVIAKIANLSE